MPESLQQWETTRMMGWKKYAVLNGSIGWGLPMGIVMAIIMHWQGGHWSQNLVLTAVIWASGGFAVGLVKWIEMEERYLRFQAGRFSTPTPPTGPAAIRSPLMRGRRAAVR
jgi:hypothetical protein